MTEPALQLAQVNIGRARGEMTEPVMAGFVARLEEINALADASPGFVWRLQTEDGDATAVRPYADLRILINLSVWTDLAALRAYVYRSPHAAVMRGRREWFERLAHLERHGPTPYSFTFAEPFEAGGRAVSREDIPRGDACPAG